MKISGVAEIGNVSKISSIASSWWKPQQTAGRAYSGSQGQDRGSDTINTIGRRGHCLSTDDVISANDETSES